jgi:hypothetical protein
VKLVLGDPIARIVSHAVIIIIVTEMVQHALARKDTMKLINPSVPSAITLVIPALQVMLRLHVQHVQLETIVIWIIFTDAFVMRGISIMTLNYAKNVISHVSRALIVPVRIIAKIAHQIQIVSIILPIKHVIA